MLKIKPIPMPAGYDHPEPPFDVLPKHEFTMGIIAPKGSGKTTLIANLLWFYRKYFHNIYVFSPTVLSDEKWDWLKKQKLLGENKALKEWLKKEKKKNDKKIVEQPPPENSIVKEKEFDPKIPEECFYHFYNEEDLSNILERKKMMIDILKEHEQPKYLADRDLFIFDDLVGSSLFSLARENVFKGFNTRHRHYSASVIMVSQAYKEIPKTVRTNWTCLVIFEIANDREIKVVYEENTMGYKEADWLQMYEHATKEDFSFLYLNAKKPRALRCMKNFDKVLFQKEID